MTYGLVESNFYDRSSLKNDFRRSLRVRQQIWSPKSTHFFEIPLVPGPHISKHSGNAKIFDFFGMVRKLGPKNQKRVNFRSFFQEFQMWIVLFWLNLHDWSYLGCYKALWNTNFEPLKFAKFDHQVALRPLFTFSFCLVLTMFPVDSIRIFLMGSEIFMRTINFWNNILGLSLPLAVNDVFVNKQWRVLLTWFWRLCLLFKKTLLESKLVGDITSFDLTPFTMI